MECQPKFHFRGVFLPAEVILQVIEGKISKTKLLILIMVEALVECRGKGCWATNDYFARTLDLNANYVSGCINELVKDGLLIMKNNEGRRYLETPWSMSTNETFQKNLKGGSEKPEGGVQKNLNHNHKDKKKNKKESYSRSTGAGEPDAGFFEFEHKSSKCLQEAVRRYYPQEADKWTPRSLRSWPAEFTLLKKEYEEEELGELLSFHVDCLKNKPAYYPEAYCARTFRLKLPKIIKARERLHAPKLNQCTRRVPHPDGPERIQLPNGTFKLQSRFVEVPD